MNILRITTLTCAICILGWSTRARAYASAEILTTDTYQYGRFEASIRFPAGSGVVGSFFLWKDGSEVEGTFWNELDFETIDANCQLKTNAYYGDPAVVHSQAAAGAAVCGAFHTFAYEWTPDYVAWLVDGTEVRRETGEAAAAYRDNTAEGMQLRFNLWPGDASFGGTFDPNLLPVYEDIDWVQYSSYDGTGFVLEWREDFTAGIPAGWELGTWDSPKGQSTHSMQNAGVVDGVLVLALTADDAQGIPGVMATTGAGGSGPAAAAATGVTATSGGDAGGSGGSSASGGTLTGMGGASSTATDSVATSNVGAATVAGEAATNGSATSGATGSASPTVTGGVVTASTGATTTAGGTTAGEGPGNSTAFGGTNGSSGNVASPSEGDDSGCACRAAGGRPTTGLPTSLRGVALLALGVLVNIRRRRRR